MHILNTLNKISPWLKEHGQPAFREKQITQWLFEKRAPNWDAMTNLPATLREELAEAFPIWTTEITKHTTAEDGTEKLLLTFEDGRQVECVLLRDRVRRTFCISTQVGCGMGCVFCASGIGGVDRNLTTGEILEQVLRLQQLFAADEKLTHLVVMGMGEPLANLDGLLPALAWVHNPEGLGISARRITISTVGLPKAIDRLSQTEPRYRLAVSLHAPNEELRNELIPINAKTGLQNILAAADRYFESSGRRLTFEYVLLAKINDRPAHAHQLVTLLKDRTVMLNVIPYNPVEGLPYKTPSTAAQNEFQEILESAGIEVQFRHRKGSKIDAACGQLRRNVQAEQQTLHSLE